MVYETIVDKESDGDILNKYVNNYHLPITEDIDVNNKTFWDKGDDKLDKCPVVLEGIPADRNFCL